jgi:hypothetical protein
VIGRVLAAVPLAATLVACSAAATPDPSSPFDEVSIEGPRDLPLNFASREGRPVENGGIVFDPISAPLDHGVAYRFDLGHCGLGSPVDLDGSFWTPLEGTTAAGGALDLDSDGEMINGTAGVVVVIGDEARFRTASGSVVRFERHAGEREFPLCE